MASAPGKGTLGISPRRRDNCEERGGGHNSWAVRSQSDKAGVLFHTVAEVAARFCHNDNQSHQKWLLDSFHKVLYDKVPDKYGSHISAYAHRNVYRYAQPRSLHQQCEKPPKAGVCAL